MIKTLVKDTLLILIGIFSASLGIKGFLVPNHFIDGGLTGVSLLTSELTHWPVYYIIPMVNLPFLILGYKQFGKRFFIKAVCAIGGLSLLLLTVPFPTITEDKLLVSVFGGILLGLGIGFTLRAGSILDGTEILSILLQRKYNITIGDTILAFNIILFSVGSYILNLESILYSILTYFSASKMVDFMVYGLNEYIGVYIISPEHEHIQTRLIQELGKGGTILHGKGAYTKENKEVLFLVITRLEIPKIKQLVETIDPKSFIIFHKVSDVQGGKLKKKQFQ